jgi:hypothetical protein
MVQQGIMGSDQRREDCGDDHGEQHEAKEPAGIATNRDERTPE